MPLPPGGPQPDDQLRLEPLPIGEERGQVGVLGIGSWGEVEQVEDSAATGSGEVGGDGRDDAAGRARLGKPLALRGVYHARGSVPGGAV